jgi:TetR/AcrR family transcriptional regulator, transcriptional repressor of aconitase
MPRLTEARRRDRRDQIAAAAFRCFARSGFAGTSMADIIAESGLSAGSIYSHFDGKADLIRYVAIEELDRRFEDVARTVDDADSPLTPGRIAAGVFGDLRVDRARAQILLQIWAEVPRDPELAVMGRDNIARFRGIIREALRPWAHSRVGAGGDVEAMATAGADATLAALQGSVVRIVFDPDADAAAQAAALAAALD